MAFAFFRKGGLSIKADDNGISKRHSRPFDLLVFLLLLANLAMVASMAALCRHIGLLDELKFPISQWIVFISSAMFAPPLIAVSKSLPTISYSMCCSGILTFTGLMAAAYTTEFTRMIVFCPLVGIGITWALTAASISLAPLFLLSDRRCCLVILVAAVGIMGGFHSLTTSLLAALDSAAFFVLGPFLLVLSVLPILSDVCKEKSLVSSQYNHYSDNKEPLGDEEEPYCLADKGCGEEDKGKQSLCQTIKRRFGFIMFPEDGWFISLVSVLVWLLWAVGVDSTWLALIVGSSFSVGDVVVLMQIIFSLLILAIKMLTEPKRNSPLITGKSSQNGDRLLYSCNYLYLGFLGVCGLLLSFFPAHVVAFNSHLLFTIGFALQFDDLSDMDWKEKSQGADGRLIKGVSLKPLDKLELKKSNEDVCCLICHLLSLLMMSLLALLLGLQVTRFVTYIFSLPPFSYLFTRYGLVSLSILSILIPLCQPDKWLG